MLKHELIDHLESVYPILTPIEYKDVTIGHYNHWKIYKYYGISKSEKWYKHQPESIIEAKDETILWDFAIQTVRKIKNKILVIMVKDYKKKELPSK